MRARNAFNDDIASSERRFSSFERAPQSPRLSTLIISVTKHYRLIENKLPCDQDIRYFIEISDREPFVRTSRVFPRRTFPRGWFER